MTISERIRTEAIKQNTTLAALERAAGLGNGTIRRWDTNSPSVDKLAKIADLLSLSLDYLFYGCSPSDFPTSNSENQLLYAFNELSIDDQDEVMDIIEMKLARARARAGAGSETADIAKNA